MGKAEEMENGTENTTLPANGATTNGANGVHDEDHVEAPKKKKKRTDLDESISTNGVATPSSLKKKKKRDKKELNDQPIEAPETPTTEKKKKKKKKEIE